MKWFTGDWHLGHQNVLKFDKRPFTTLKKMNVALIENINDNVKKDDVLYVLGDVAFKVNQVNYIESFIDKIVCDRMILILGNHDKFKPFDYVEIGFESVHTSLEIPEGYILIHDPAIAGCLIDRKFICAHVHLLFKYTNNCVNVGCPVWDYKPVSLDQIEELFNSVEGEIHELQ